MPNSIEDIERRLESSGMIYSQSIAMDVYREDVLFLLAEIRKLDTTIHDLVKERARTSRRTLPPPPPRRKWRWTRR